MAFAWSSLPAEIAIVGGRAPSSELIPKPVWPVFAIGGAVMALADAKGTLLWVCGNADNLRRAERIGFVEGSNWDWDPSRSQWPERNPPLGARK